MTRQYSTALRNAWLDTYEAEIGASSLLRLYTGGKPANCAAGASGTQLVEMELPADWMGDPSGGVTEKDGTWSGTVTADGICGHYRLYDNAGTTCHEQGTVTRAFALVTTAATAANSNVLTFASTPGVAAGMKVAGAGVPDGAAVLAVTSETITLSAPSTAGVGEGVKIYLGDTSGDLWLNSTALTASQGLTIVDWRRTSPGA